MMSKTVWLMVGLPGSGKSTWAKEFSKETGAIVVGAEYIIYMMNGGDYHSKPHLRKLYNEIERFAARKARTFGIL